MTGDNKVSATLVILPFGAIRRLPSGTDTNRWDTHTVSSSDLHTLPLAVEGGDHISKILYIHAWDTPDASSTVYAIAALEGSSTCLSFCIALPLKLSPGNQVGAVQKILRISSPSTPVDTWKIIGMANSGRVLYQQDHDHSPPHWEACHALIPVLCRKITSPTFPIGAEMSIKAPATSIEPWSGAVVYTGRNCAVVVFYD